MKLKKTAIRLTKPRAIVLAVLALLAVMGSYTYWSFQTWNGYEDSYTTWRQDVGHDIDTALQLPTASGDDRLKKITALGEVVTAIADKQSICGVSGAVEWQRNIGGLESRINTCNEMMRSVTTYGDELRRALAYLEAERKIADIISSTATNNKQTEKTWDAQLAAWTKAVSEIGSMQTSEDFAPTKEYALKYAKKMESVWKDVVAAHKAQNKTKYLKAYADLVSVHEMLATLASDSQDKFKGIASDLQAEYDILK